jgi:hypothetical protein
MISIENRAAFEKAEQKAREVKPRVWALTFGSYMVEGHDRDYRVTFSTRAGHWFAECNCEAHKRNRPCYHCPAAWACHRIQIGIRQQLRGFEAAQLPSISNWTATQEAA